jgi:hypothetical protein
MYPLIWGAMMTSIMGLSVWALAGSAIDYKDDGFVEYPIVALKTVEDSKISGGGSFLAWSISSNSEEQYVIMNNLGNNRYKKEYLACSKTYVVEEAIEHCEPRVKYVRSVPVKRWWYCPWVRFYFNNAPIYHKASNATIYVPEGAVIQKIMSID